MTMQIFSNAAPYYKYRPPYPAELLEHLVTRTVGSRGHSLIDWGCGTGEIAIPLSSSFDGVIAVDADPEMVQLARQKAAEEGASNITWSVGRAEDIELADSAHDLIVAGSSFHWMDRQLLSRRAFRALTQTGSIALTGGGSDVWDIKCAWHEVAVRVIKRWLGSERRAGGGNYSVTGRHGDFLEPVGFRLESESYRVGTIWNTDSIVGYLYSTSFASPAVFENPEQRSGFEADLRTELSRLSQDDEFPEQLEFYLMIGRKQP
jgi:SAM-dependent methyltransferase